MYYILWVLFIILLAVIYLGIRNKFVYTVSIWGIHASSNYSIDMINKGGHYIPGSMEEMGSDYIKLLFSFWEWSRYSGIKKEYRELLKPYLDKWVAENKERKIA